MSIGETVKWRPGPAGAGSGADGEGVLGVIDDEGPPDLPQQPTSAIVVSEKASNNSLSAARVATVARTISNVSAPTRVLMKSGSGAVGTMRAKLSTARPTGGCDEIQHKQIGADGPRLWLPRDVGRNNRS
jgi:hypothetical protein